MKWIKLFTVVLFGVFAISSVSSASILDQAIYNVVGQVTNAIGARVGDEVYYGNKRKRVRKRRSKRKSVPKIPIITDEKKIQKTLTSLGFYRGKIDGEVNSFETRSAIKEMNRAYSISNNASLKPEVKDMLIYLGALFGFDRYLIALGKDKKIKGKKIQTALKIHGHYHDKIDGLVGKGTRRCISSYKGDNGMSSGGSLDFEEEYQLISSAKEKNDKNIEESIVSLKSFGIKSTQKPNFQSQVPVVSAIINAGDTTSNQAQVQANLHQPSRQIGVTAQQSKQEKGILYVPASTTNTNMEVVR